MNVKDRRGRPVEVQIVEVIQCAYVKGDGTREDPVRGCTAYWTKEGKFLWENDPLISGRQSQTPSQSADPE